MKKCAATLLALLAVLAAGAQPRNLALNRMAAASSSQDRNLTAQLATDGIIDRRMPPAFTVTTDKAQGSAPNAQPENLIDGNTVTSFPLYGPDTAAVDLRWRGMAITADTLRLVVETAYGKDAPSAGNAARALWWSVEVFADIEGNRVGEATGTGRLGYVVSESAPTDPNKQSTPTTLTLCRAVVSIPLSRPAASSAAARPVTTSRLRLVFRAPTAQWFRVYEIDTTDPRHPTTASVKSPFPIYRVPGWRQHNASWLPADSFVSAWASDPAATAREPQWLMVDLGRQCRIDSVVPRWVIAPKHFSVLCSADGATATSGPARYVRLIMDAPQDTASQYVLTELQVFGEPLGSDSAKVPAASAPAGLAGWSVARVAADGTSPEIAATVPGTVLQSYIDAGAVPDNRYGDNLSQISESFFNADFIYRARFDAPSVAHAGDRVSLAFDGINWKADVAVNGAAVGHIDGAFTRARFDITRLLKPRDNRLEVRIHRVAHPGAAKTRTRETTGINGGAMGADSPTFLPTIGWDWMPTVPGRNIGIHAPVRLEMDRGVTLADPRVLTVLAAADTLATLTPAVVVANATDRQQRLTVSGAIGTVAFSRQVTLAAGERREVAFSPDSFPQLRDCRLALWWPNGMGAPYRHRASFAITRAGRSTAPDTLATLRWLAGLREVAIDASPVGSSPQQDALQIRVNHKRLIPLGGNWGYPEINLRYAPAQYDTAVALHRDMHLNIIRSWAGQTTDEAFYEACDRYGIVVWQDFWLANPWDGPDPDDEEMFMGNARDFVSRLRRHASVVLYCGRNEGYPPATLDSALRRAVATLYPGTGYISSSADGSVSGHGPYRLMPATYYFTHLSGKLHTEEGMPCVPTWESLERFRTPDSLLYLHDFCLQGAQDGESYLEEIARRYGQPADARQLAERAQRVNYDGARAMFESRRIDRQGLLLWMTHPAWPSMTWQTYDYFLKPTGAYHGVRTACEPLHVMLNPATRRVLVTNSHAVVNGPLTVRAQVVAMDGAVLADTATTIYIGEDETIDVMPLPAPARLAADRRARRLIRLTLSRGDAVISRNEYADGL